jgi:hypothetical protein
MLAQPRHSGPGTVDRAPEVDLEELTHVFDGDFGELSIERNPGVVDPGVQGAEFLDGGRGDPLHVLFIRHVGHYRVGSATAVPDPLYSGSQLRLISRAENEAGAAFGRAVRGREAYPASPAGYDHDLLVQWLELDTHGPPPYPVVRVALRRD